MSLSRTSGEIGEDKEQDWRWGSAAPLMHLEDLYRNKNDKAYLAQSVPGLEKLSDEELQEWFAIGFDRLKGEAKNNLGLDTFSRVLPDKVKSGENDIVDLYMNLPDDE